MKKKSCCQCSGAGMVVELEQCRPLVMVLVDVDGDGVCYCVDGWHRHCATTTGRVVVVQEGALAALQRLLPVSRPRPFA